MPAAQPNWDRIDTVLLDMDGTVLDLAFDNWFWRRHVPTLYGEANGLSADQAHARLEPEFRRWEGTLQWYCLDHWSELTGLDLREIKAAARASIKVLPTSAAFLEWVESTGRSLWLATNAHRATLEIKLEETGIDRHFDRIVSSHDYGMPKEHDGFWQALEADGGPDRARSLFADDSLPVLRAARRYGIAELVAIRRPDSSAPMREVSEFPAVDSLEDLVPVAAPP